MITKIYIAYDHGALELGNMLFGYLIGKGIEKGYSVKNLGSIRYDKDDDYPPFATAVAEAVAHDPGSFGVLLCTSGVGMAVTANKVPGIRAMHFQGDLGIVKSSREHNNANVICAGSAQINYEQMKEAVETFVSILPSREARHVRRVRQIEKKTRSAKFSVPIKVLTGVLLTSVSYLTTGWISGIFFGAVIFFIVILFVRALKNS